MESGLLTWWYGTERVLEGDIVQRLVVLRVFLNVVKMGDVRHLWKDFK